MAKNVNNSETTEEVEPETQPVKEVKKSHSWEYDQTAGKILIKTVGYANGEKLHVEVNGKKGTVEIEDNHGVYASGSGFKEFPAVTIND